MVVQKVRSSWFPVRASRSCHRSRPVCDWWIVPGAEHLNVFNSSTCAKSQNSRLAFTSATITSQSKPLLKPWVLPFTPTYRGKRTSSRAQSHICLTKTAKKKPDLTRQCSFPWFSQWPVLPVRMILWSWLVFTQMISSTRSYLEKKRSDRSKDGHSGLDGSQSTNGKNSPPKTETLPAQFHRPVRGRGEQNRELKKKLKSFLESKRLPTCQWPKGRWIHHLAEWGCWASSSRHRSASRRAAPCGCPRVGRPSPPQTSPGWTRPSIWYRSRSTAEKTHTHPSALPSTLPRPHLAPLSPARETASPRCCRHRPPAAQARRSQPGAPAGCSQPRGGCRSRSGRTCRCPCGSRCWGRSSRPDSHLCVCWWCDCTLGKKTTKKRH